MFRHVGADAVFDGNYIQRLIERDPQVEEHFIRYFGELIRVAVLTRAGSWRLVEDVRQETFLRVLQLLRSQGALEKPERLGAFVYSVCRRVLAEHIREEGQGGREPAADGEGHPSYRLLVDESLVRREQRREIERALQALTPLEHKALRMVFLEERDRREVCRRLGLSQDYLRVVLCRAKARLRDRLGGGWKISRLNTKAYSRSPGPDETREASTVTDQ